MEASIQKPSDTKRKLLSLSSEQIEIIDHNVALMIIEDMRPFSLFNTEAARRLFKLFDYEPPSRTIIANKLETIYEAYKNQLKSVIKDEFISITSDGWTRHSEKFISITLQFIKNDRLYNGLLSCNQLSSHTVQNFASHIKEVLIDFGIDITKQVISMTTDNAANMRLARELLQVRYIKSERRLFFVFYTYSLFYVYT